MNTLQQQLVKHKTFLANFRHTIKPEKTMNAQTEQTTQVSRSTGGQGANKRYKRSPEELLADIERVDQLVASGKYNQIEALNHIGLQSSVYHYKKKQLAEQVAKSLKPRKSATRSETTQSDYAIRKQALLNKMEQAPVVKEEKKAAPAVETKSENAEVARLKAELAAYKEKYAKLCQNIVENELLNK